MALPSLKISEALLFNPQVLADSDLAWRLQAEEYKQAYHNKSGVNFSFKSEVIYQFQQSDQEKQSFTLRETAGDGDCFFHAVNLPGFNRKVLVKKLLECSSNQDVLKEDILWC